MAATVTMVVSGSAELIVVGVWVGALRIVLIMLVRRLVVCGHLLLLAQHRKSW